MVPHFEKMAYDNSELLKNYVHGFQTFVEPEYARVAREIVRWMDEWLSDRELGGFYASQDADFSLDDDGDYFTWTRDEAAAVLTAEELAVAGAYYDIGEIGDMHHNPAKNVLHVRTTIQSVAKSNGLNVEVAKELLAQAKAKMYAARLQRPTPYVDKTIYMAWNGMCISAYIEAGRVLDMPEALAFGLKSLDRVLAEAWDCECGNGACGCVWRGGWQVLRKWPGVLDDYVFVGHAALDAWEATGEMRYYDAAEEIAESDDCAVLRPDGVRVLRYGDCAGGRDAAGSAGDAAEAAAGFADAGGQSVGRGAADAAGVVEWARGLCGEGAGDDGDVCRCGGALWAVCGELWAGAAVDGAASRCRCA